MSKGLWDKFKNMVGLNEELQYEEEEEMNEMQSIAEEQPQQFLEELSEDVPLRRRKPNARVTNPNPNIIDFSTPPSNEMIVVEPNSYDDAIKIVSLLKSKVAVIISFINSTLSHEDTMHIIDFICGAVCAIDGNQKIVAPGVYLFTPGNININSLDSEQPQARVIDKSGNNLFLTINDITFNKKKITKVS